MLSDLYSRGVFEIIIATSGIGHWYGMKLFSGIDESFWAELNSGIAQSSGMHLILTIELNPGKKN